jgi:hypothetical protein
MKAELILIPLLLILTSFLQTQDEYAEREAVLLSDSLSVKEVLGSIKSDFVRKEIEVLLARISESKKIFKPFRIDFYSRNKHNYKLSEYREMTVSELLDSLSDNIRKAKILRINKLDLNGDGSKKFALTDNSFKDLDKEPEYRDKAEVLRIIEETALSANKKSSLEWIWGRSPENDAYYSTKLTYFDDRFSLYPEYRFFVGYDPLRDRKGWFFSLAEHAEDLDKMIAEAVSEPQISNYDIDENSDISEDITVAEAEEFDCGSSSYADIDYETDIIIYEKDPEGNLKSSPQKMNAGNLLKLIYERSGQIEFIRLTSTDYSFEGNEVRKSENESMIEISGDVSLCSRRIKSFLSEGMTDAGRKRSVEFITGSNSDKLSYNAAIITVYDGQTSYFRDYKIYASSEVRKDKNSWFNNL